jgi:hypothetical protein
MSSDLDGSKEVKIGNEIHSLDVVPAPESTIVAEEKDMLLGAMDLKTLVDDLGHAGAFIRSAYNRVMAAGPQYTELQIEIQQLIIDITKLYDDLALTVSNLKMESATVLSNLQATYGYLLRDKVNLAIETLSSVSGLAGKMEEAGFELHKKFEKEKKEVTNTIEKTQEVQMKAASRIKEKEKEQQKLQQELEEAQRLEQEATEGEAISGIKYILGACI